MVPIWSFGFFFLGGSDCRIGANPNHGDFGTLITPRRLVGEESKPGPTPHLFWSRPCSNWLRLPRARANGLDSRRRATEGVRREAWGARPGRGVASAAGAVVAVAAGEAAAAAAARLGVRGPAVGDGGGELQPAEGAAAVSVGLASGTRDGAPR